MNCSGVHRSLGVHISKVRSPKFDKMDEDQIAFLTAIGNRKSNLIWEHQLITAALKAARPDPNSNNEMRDMWIRAKYELKSFLGIPKGKKVKHFNRLAFQAILEDKPEDLLKALVWGADLSLQNVDEDGRTILHQAVMYGNPVCVECVVQSFPGAAGELSPQEARGWTPLHYAAYQDDVAVVRMLLARGGVALSLETENEGLTALQICLAHREDGAVEPESAALLRQAEAKGSDKQM